MKAGVLALQGDFREHAAMFALCGATPVEVRRPEELEDVDCLAIPGGESTSIARLATLYGLLEPICRRAEAGLPILGTCAGLIVMARRVTDGEPLFGLLDVDVRRNAYGRQTDSFETDLQVEGVGPVRGVFIRAPLIEATGPGVAVLARYAEHPVAVQEGKLLATSFHPEIAGDPRLHARLLELAG